jgi:hypothetical protein
VLRRAFLVIVVGLCVSWPAAAHAQVTEPIRPVDQVVLSGDVTVARGTVVQEVVVFSGSATVSGVVQHDVVVLDGAVTIAGQVGGDVIALHGPIHLLATAQVTGDVLAGGNLEMADGAEVAGAVRRDVGFTLAGPVAALGALLVSVAMAVSILLGGLLMLLLAPRGAERAADAARSAPLASAGWGLLSSLLLPVLAIALTATVVGLPLGLAVLLGLALLWLLGLVVATFAIGRLVIRAPRSRVASLFVGWAIVAAVGLVPLLNVGIWTLAGMFGFGTMIIAAWRSRSGRELPLPGEPAGRHRAPRKPVEQPTLPVTVVVPASDEVAEEARPAEQPATED